MTRTATHVSDWISTLGIGALVLIATALLAGGVDAQERTGDPAKWRNYWTQLYPVFTHPRCLNCHGATDPYSGENHGGGPLDLENDPDEGQCIGCHTANTVLVPGRCEEGHRILPDEGRTSEACVAGGEPGEVRVRTGDWWGIFSNPPPFVGLDMRALCLAVKPRKSPHVLE